MSELTKITGSFYRPLWRAFDTQIRSLPVSRDQFFTHVIRKETPHLAKAMEGKKLSSAANREIYKRLAELRDIEKVSIGVTKAVANDLNTVIRESRMVRDAFFNRLIVFLRGSDAVLDGLGLPKRLEGRTLRSYGSEISMPVSPLKVLEDVLDDPLWYLREVTKEVFDTSIYLLEFPSAKMDGFRCWLDDKDLSGTKAHKKDQAELADAVRTLTEFESPPAAKAGQE